MSTTHECGHWGPHPIHSIVGPLSLRKKVESSIVDVNAKQKDEFSTAYSQAVTHPSTNAAQYCLTSVIGRELVLSIRYGRIH